MAMCLILLGLLAECPLDAFAELEFRSGSGALEVGEAFPSEIFHLRKKGLQLLDALSQVVDDRGFGPRPF